MPQLLDARGLLCPLPALKARRALAALAPGETLVVLATDPEAPVDVGALAAEGGHGFRAERESGGWRLTVTKAKPAPS
jgi:tRNA 2-thiouridine synthesizing protein A